MTGEGRKAALRDRMRQVRGAIPPEERARLAAEIEKRLFGLSEIGAARVVLGYSSFGSEVPTDSILRRLHASEARVLIPYLEGGDMEAGEILPGEELVPGGYGPLEPARRVPADPREVDLVLAPGLAFDARGGRLGYGGGAYDRYLARLAPGTPIVGLAFAVQLVDEVPAGPGDVAVHLVVTDRGITDAR